MVTHTHSHTPHTLITNQTDVARVIASTRAARGVAGSRDAYLKDLEYLNLWVIRCNLPELLHPPPAQAPVPFMWSQMQAGLCVLVFIFVIFVWRLCGGCFFCSLFSSFFRFSPHLHPLPLSHYKHIFFLQCQVFVAVFTCCYFCKFFLRNLFLFLLRLATCELELELELEP